MTNLALVFDRVSFAYPGGPPVLNSVSLEIAQGERVALIGRNGSGKSTLALHANGILRPTSGRVVVRGEDIAGVPTSRVAADVAVLFQDPDLQILEEEVFDEVAFGPRNLGLSGTDLEERVGNALLACGLDQLRKGNPYLLGSARRKLVALASVLAMPSTVLVLDEPTTGIDAPAVARIQEAVRRLADQGRTVLATSHDMRFVAETFDRVVVLRDGSVVLDGPPHHVFAESAWSMLNDASVRPPAAAILGARLGLGSTPREADLAASLKRKSSETASPA